MMKKRMGIIGLIALAAALTLAGCAGQSQPEVLYFYNWSDYIDETLIADFEEETGIQVVEDTFGSNEELFAKLQADSGQYDVIVPSDYMVANMIENGMLATLDKDALENDQFLDPVFSNPPYDPGLEHCIPYLWGTTGIGFDSADFEGAEITSAEVMFNPEMLEELGVRLSFLDDSRETLGIALNYLGYSPNSTDEAELEEAKQLLLGVRDYIVTFDSETYEENLLTDETNLAFGYNGDFFLAVEENEDIVYVIPEEGTTVWTDNLCIPVEVAQDEARYARALQWIDFLHRPENMARIVNYVYYPSPNSAANELVDPEITGDPSIYPDEETFARLYFLEPVGEATELYDRIWTEVIAGQ
ncbi:MAG: spermidine/putrescine ABC transporter substrate-binding protein [Chloroflexi bacterium]|nr:spermidine/putrescine ABC transporter substrate-binding protein [Chloroflexota bacterium]